MSWRRAYDFGQLRRIGCLGIVCLCLLSARAAASELQLSQKVYDQIAQAQELIQQKQPQKAVAQLRALSKDTSLIPYETAVLHQTLGYAYAALDQPNQAASAFQKSLTSKALPSESAQTVRYNLAQIQIAAERYAEGARILETWLAKASQVKPEVRALLAQVYSQLRRHPEAQQHIQLAIDQAVSFNEEWHQLLLLTHVEQQGFAQAATVLQQLLTRFPRKKTYWLQLSQVYRQAKQNRQAASTLALAHKLGLLEEQEVLQVVQFYLHLGLPYKAADILTDGLQKKIVAETAERQELLVTCWLHAKEYQRALDVLGQQARNEKTGIADIRRAELFVQRERWKEAAEAAEAGLRKGGLSDTGHAYILLGTAEYRSGRFSESKVAFHKAAAYNTVAKQTRQWLALIEQEVNNP